MNFRTPSLAGSSGQDSPKLAGWGNAASPSDQGNGMQKYSDLLKDPRWQKTRLKKLEAAEWQCQKCYDDQTMLSVHHKRYIKGRMPWEYDECELVVLCQPCHEEEHVHKALREALLARMPADGPCSPRDFFAVAAGAVFGDRDFEDEELNAIVMQICEDAPYQFNVGLVASAIEDVLFPGSIAIFKLYKALRGIGEAELRADLLALLERHNIHRQLSKWAA